MLRLGHQQGRRDPRRDQAAAEEHASSRTPPREHDQQRSRLPRASHRLHYRRRLEHWPPQACSRLSYAPWQQRRAAQHPDYRILCSPGWLWQRSTAQLPQRARWPRHGAAGTGLSLSAISDANVHAFRCMRTRMSCYRYPPPHMYPPPIHALVLTGGAFFGEVKN